MSSAGVSVEGRTHISVVGEDRPSTRIAVVIPCYNHAHFLPEAVASVCAQTFERLELVIVDDGSPDNTAEVASRLIADNPERQIRLVRQRNQGLPASRNRGIETTDAEYILTLDADDRIAPDFVERCVAGLDDHPGCSIAYTGQQNFGNDNTFHAHPAYDFLKLTHANQIGVASVFRRQAWEDVGGFSEHLCTREGAAATLQYEDWDFWIGCGEYGHFGLHLPEAVFYYRVREGSMFTQVNDQGSKAHVVLNHPVLYTPEQMQWAHGVVEGNPAALAIHGPRYVIPVFGPPRVQNVRSGGAIKDTRRLATIAYAQELIAEPELLISYTSTFSDADDATLVVFGSVDELNELGHLLAAVGAAGDDAADILGMTTDDPDVTVVNAASMVDAMLTRRAIPLPVPLPRLDDSRIAELRPTMNQPRRESTDS